MYAQINEVLSIELNTQWNWSIAVTMAAWVKPIGALR